MRKQQLLCHPLSLATCPSHLSRRALSTSSMEGMPARRNSTWLGTMSSLDSPIIRLRQVVWNTQAMQLAGRGCPDLRSPIQEDGQVNGPINQHLGAQGHPVRAQHTRPQLRERCPGKR